MSAALMSLMQLTSSLAFQNNSVSPSTSTGSSALIFALSVTASITLFIVLFFCYLYFIHDRAPPSHSTLRHVRVRGGDLELTMLCLQHKGSISELYFHESHFGADAYEKVMSRREVREMLDVGNWELREDLRLCGFEKEVEVNQGRDWWLEDAEEEWIGEDEKSFSPRDLESIARRFNWVWEWKVARRLEEGMGENEKV